MEVLLNELGSKPYEKEILWLLVLQADTSPRVVVSMSPTTVTNRLWPGQLKKQQTESDSGSIERTCTCIEGVQLRSWKKHSGTEQELIYLSWTLPYAPTYTQHDPTANIICSSVAGSALAMPVHEDSCPVAITTSRHTTGWQLSPETKKQIIDVKK